MRLQLRLGLFLFLFAAILSAAQVSGVVKDPSGLPVAKATATLDGQSTTSDEQGRFHFPEVPPGPYALTVSRDGFEAYRETVQVWNAPLEIAVTLKIDSVVTTVRVSASLRNSDPNYRDLRSGEPRGVFRVHDLTLQRDVGTLTFQSGAFSFLPPVLGRVTCAIFIGNGHFNLHPIIDIAARHLQRLSGSETVDEDFSSAIFYFTDSTYEEIMKAAAPVDESPKPYRDALHRLLETTRSRDEVPRSLLERVLMAEDAPNIEAEILAELYNPAQRNSFRAFIHGAKHPNFRYIVNPSGALPGLSTPEEVALLNYDSANNRDGVWYLTHTRAEFLSGHASSSEDKRLIAPIHYNLDVSMNASGRLTTTCDLEFRSLAAGTRVIKFDLLPDLQVSSLTLDRRDVAFIQENRNRDGSFYTTLPAPLQKDRVYHAVFEYTGDYVLFTRTGIEVRPRVAWYPRPVGNSRAMFDLIFRVKGYTVVAAGDLTGNNRDQGANIFHWATKVPIPIDAFNLGDFGVRETTDSQSNSRVSIYLSNIGRGAATPSFRVASEVVGNAIRCFQAWFGPLPYSHLSVTQATADSGIYSNGVVTRRGPDSLPGLLLVPATYMMDTGARYGVFMGGLDRTVSLNSQIAVMPSHLDVNLGLDEGLPRLTAQQWWGNAITPATFHDEWITSGLTDFSASLYDLAAKDRGNFLLHWQRARDYLLGRGEPMLNPSLGAANNLGFTPNDAGPVWLGILIDPFVTPRFITRQAVHSVAPQVISTKGSFIIHMLRCLMFDNQSEDRDFVALLHDFTTRFSNRAITTEQFIQLVEAHMKPAMNLDGNGRMDWFFNDWVYNSKLPSYRLEYAVRQEGGRWIASGHLTQSGVFDSFRMRLPIYAEFGKKANIVGSAVIAGNNTGDFRVELPAKPNRLALNVNFDVLTDKQEVVQSSK